MVIGSHATTGLRGSSALDEAISAGHTLAVLTLVDAEIEADRVLRAAGLHDADAPSWRALVDATRVRDLPVAVRYFAPGTLGDEIATHREIEGVHVIFVDESKRDRARAFIVCHELGHVVHDARPLAVNEERWVQRFASACLLPEASMRRAWAEHGCNLPKLAYARRHVSMTVVARRIADLELAPVWFYERGELQDGEPSTLADQLASEAKLHGKAESGGVRAWRPKDAPSRVIVLAQ